VLDIDRSGEVDALSDGLLVLRYLFGFRDAILIDDATELDCTQCEADDIETYIASIRDEHLDVDDDGEEDALTDGLLVLRYLFGFRDGVLVGGAVDTDECGRCLADDIEVFIQERL
jgi:hypothetical protein